TGQLKPSERPPLPAQRMASAEPTAVSAPIATPSEPSVLPHEVTGSDVVQPVTAAETAHVVTDPAHLDAESVVTETVHTAVAPQATAVPTDTLAHSESAGLPRTSTEPA